VLDCPESDVCGHRRVLSSDHLGGIIQLAIRGSGPNYMDLRTFIAELVKALAWPLTVLIVLVAFRRSLLDLLPQLRKLKYDKFEFQFAKEIAEVERRVQTSLPAVSEKPRLEAVRQKLITLAMSSPGAAVVEAARYLESELIETASRHKLDLTPTVRDMPRVVAALLYKDGLLTEAQHDLSVRLRDLRNEVTHSTSQIVDIERAVSYVDSVIRLISSLNTE